jgi:hypothetical protein
MKKGRPCFKLKVANTAICANATERDTQIDKWKWKYHKVIWKYKRDYSGFSRGGYYIVTAYDEGL